MAQIENLTFLQRKLKKLANKHGKKNPMITVGYTQGYAIFVHETHKTNSKYLETPTRQLAPRVGQIVNKAVARGATLEQGLVLGGLLIQRESQKVVPVDTGALKASAFTAKESDLETEIKAAEARAKSKEASARFKRKKK